MTHGNFNLSAVKALTLASTNHFLAHRADVILWMVAGLMPLIMMSAWMTMAGSGYLGSYSKLDIAAYFLAGFIVRQSTMMWVDTELDRHIRYGEMSAYLMRPIDPYWSHVAAHLGELTIRIPVTLVIYVILGMSLKVVFSLSVADVCLFIPALIFAWVLRFEVAYLSGLLAFWTEYAIAFSTLIFSVYLLASGLLIPIDLLPSVLGRTLSFTPFPYMLDFPARLLAGRYDSSAILIGFSGQAIWLVILVLGRRYVWRTGLRSYTAQGS